MGAEGWELIDTERVGSWDFGNADTLTFRRPKQGSAVEQQGEDPDGGLRLLL